KRRSFSGAALFLCGAVRFGLCAGVAALHRAATPLQVVARLPRYRKRERLNLAQRLVRPVTAAERAGEDRGTHIQCCEKLAVTGTRVSAIAGVQPVHGGRYGRNGSGRERYTGQETWRNATGFQPAE